MESSPCDTPASSSSSRQKTAVEVRSAKVGAKLVKVDTRAATYFSSEERRRKTGGAVEQRGKATNTSLGTPSLPHVPGI